MVTIAPVQGGSGTSAAAGAAGAARATGSADSAGGDVPDDYEYRPLRIDPTVSRASAAVMLSVRAEFTGWELARVLRYADGSRKVLLRRRRSQGPFPALSL